MIGAGVWHLWREAAQKPVHLGRWNWTGMAVGAATIIVSFTLDSRNVAGGGMPRPFHWPLFGAGMIIGILSYIGAAPNTSQAVDRS
jgi:hypothetical protein